MAEQDPKHPSIERLEKIGEYGVNAIQNQPIMEFSIQMTKVLSIFIAYARHFSNYQNEFSYTTKQLICFMDLYVTRLEQEGYPEEFDRSQMIIGFGQTLNGAIITISGNNQLSAENRFDILKATLRTFRRHWNLFPVTTKVQAISYLMALYEKEKNDKIKREIGWFLRDKNLPDQFVN